MLMQVPMKQTRKYDLETTVLACITSSIGPDVAARSEIRAAARAIAEKRDAAALTALMERPNHGGATIATLTANLGYINALNRIASFAERFCLPDGRTPGVAEFEWRDAFSDVTTKTSQYKLDMVACTVNCGIIMGTMAVRQAYSANLGEAELLDASKFFRRAAGFFSYCIEKMPYQVAGGTVDLHAPCHTACKFAMLANAQQLLYRSCMKAENKYPASAKARIAAGARSLYEVVAKNCKSVALRDTAMGRYMAPIADVLALYFGAEADLGASAVCEAEAMAAVSGQYGLHCARIRRACLALQAAEGLLQHLPQGSEEANEIPPAVVKQAQLARGKLATALAGNVNFHEAEPETSAIPDIEPMIMAEPLDVSAMFTLTHVDRVTEPLCQLK
jgi:hypothetical protein